MGATSYNEKRVDVLCFHRSNGTTIPMKIRLEDEDGLYQNYQIRAYRCLSVPGDMLLPNGVRATSRLRNFECKIMVFEKEKIIRLLYNVETGIWIIT